MKFPSISLPWAQKVQPACSDDEVILRLSTLAGLNTTETEVSFKRVAIADDKGVEKKAFFVLFKGDIKGDVKRASAELTEIRDRINARGIKAQIGFPATAVAGMPPEERVEIEDTHQLREAARALGYVMGGVNEPQRPR